MAIKVLHLISGGDKGGAKTHIITLLKNLKSSCDAKIVCFIKDTFYDEAKASGIDIEIILQKKRTDLSIIKVLVEKINKEKYDIIHCHGARANFIGMFLKKKIDIPMVTTIHSDYLLDFKGSFYKNLIYTKLNEFSLKYFDYYIAVTEAFKNMLIDRGFNKEKIYTLYNGMDFTETMNMVDRDAFFKRYNIDLNNRFIVSLAARLDAVKNPQMLLKAAEKVLKTNKNILFLIAGDGEEMEIMKNKITEKNLGDNIKLLGFLKDPYSLFNVSNLNALTSISESFPYVIMEAARLKVPTISTNVGGIDELIEDGINGFLVDINDDEKMAEKILQAAASPQETKEMGEKIKYKVETEFSAPKMAERQVQIYKSILENRRKI
ncbi:MAG: glycosyltransferase family 4 protein [Tissierellia bacterium]|nr:glycosyltransferase family 4 protein [Tissierellia bacterium]